VESQYIRDSYFKDNEIFLNGQVRVSVAYIPGGYLIRPKHPHCKYQFEEFFGFGAGNYGFTMNRCVYLPN